MSYLIIFFHIYIYFFFFLIIFLLYIIYYTRMDISRFIKVQFSYFFINLLIIIFATFFNIHLNHSFIVFFLILNFIFSYKYYKSIIEVLYFYIIIYNLYSFIFFIFYILIRIFTYYIDFLFLFPNASFIDFFFKVEKEIIIEKSYNGDTIIKIIFYNSINIIKEISFSSSDFTAKSFSFFRQNGLTWTEYNSIFNSLLNPNDYSIISENKKILKQIINTISKFKINNTYYKNDIHTFNLHIKNIYWPLQKNIPVIKEESVLNLQKFVIEKNNNFLKVSFFNMHYWINTNKNKSFFLFKKENDFLFNSFIGLYSEMNDLPLQSQLNIIRFCNNYSKYFINKNILLHFINYIKLNNIGYDYNNLNSHFFESKISQFNLMSNVKCISSLFTMNDLIALNSLSYFYKIPLFYFAPISNSSQEIIGERHLLTEHNTLTNDLYSIGVNVNNKIHYLNVQFKFFTQSPSIYFGTRHISTLNYKCFGSLFITIPENSPYKEAWMDFSKNPKQLLCKQKSINHLVDRLSTKYSINKRDFSFFYKENLSLQNKIYKLEDLLLKEHQNYLSYNHLSDKEKSVSPLKYMNKLNKNRYVHLLIDLERLYYFYDGYEHPHKSWPFKVEIFTIPKKTNSFIILKDEPLTNSYYQLIKEKENALFKASIKRFIKKNKLINTTPFYKDEEDVD